eukprot:scaffold224483_cov26-Tisochrysis_lutea.AAC.2
MRYCSVSITPSPGCCSSSLSNKVIPSPFAAASALLTTGGSCRWSPARTARRPRSNGTQHDASRACARPQGKGARNSALQQGHKTRAIVIAGHVALGLPMWLPDNIIFR